MQRVGRHTVPPKLDLHCHDNPTPPPGPLSNQECDHSSPRPSLRVGEEGTLSHPTPKPGVWHLGPWLCWKWQLGLEGLGPSGKPSLKLGLRGSQPWARTPGSGFRLTPRPLLRGEGRKKQESLQG